VPGKPPTLEIYYYARGPAKHMRVLSYGYDQHTPDELASGVDSPFCVGDVSIAPPLGTFGKVMSSPPACTVPESRTLLLRTLQWLARRPVTVAIPVDFPTEAATSIRPEIQIPASAQ